MRAIVRVKYSLVGSVIICFLITLSTYGQSPSIFKKIDQSNGLSNSRITDVVQDSLGFFWIATKNGLNRYDGAEVKIYNKQNSNLGGNDIADLLIDHTGRLWIATLGGGLSLYDQKLDEFTTFRHRLGDHTSIPSNQINTILETSSSTLWLGTENGLSKLDLKTKHFKRYAVNDNQTTISHNSITSLFIDKKNNFWVGTFGGGLHKFDKTSATFSSIVSSDAFFTTYIHDITDLGDHHILLGTSGGGLLLYNTQTSKFYNFFQKINTQQDVNIIRTLHKNKQGDLWVGTDGNGLFKISNPLSKQPDLVHYSYNPKLDTSLSGNAIYALYEDTIGNLWVGTAWNGINVLSEHNHYKYIYSDIRGESPMPVLSVFKTPDTLYLGLDGGGLTQYINSQDQVNILGKDVIGAKYIQYIEPDKSNTYWLGTFANGLVHVDPVRKTFKQFKHKPGDSTTLSYNDVRSIYKNPQGNLWIATWGGGLNLFDSQEERFYSFRESETDSTAIASDNTIALVPDGQALWVSTFGGGLDKFDLQSKTFTHHQYQEGNPNSLSSNNLYALFKDSRGNLWIGTSGEGVNRLHIKTNQIERFENAEAIRYATIMSILEDDTGRIWFSTKQGIFSYDYKTKRFTSYPEFYGEYHINASYKDALGNLYFGGIQGVLTFDPNNIHTQNKTPKVRFTHFKLFNKEVAIGKNQVLQSNIALVDEIVLDYDMDVATFEFAALKFPSSKDTEYAIKLENFDEDWRYIGASRTATYTNLSPGNYLFMVKSRVAGSTWGDKFTAVNLKVQKPFWFTWWAFVIYFACIIGLFYVFRKYIVAWEQMKANLKLERYTHEKDTELYNLKQQFFTNISHEIRTPVTLILNAVNRLKTLDNKDQTAITSAQKNGNHLLHLVHEMLDFKNLENLQNQLKIAEDDWVVFCKEVYLSFTESASRKNITYTFYSDVEHYNVWFDPNQMEKVLYNLLVNAFKFTSPGGSITLKVAVSDEWVKLQVKDSGVGISRWQAAKIFNRFYQSQSAQEISESGFGLGLAISKEIVEKHHGKISVQSEKGKGSTFEVQLPTGNTHFDQKQLLAAEENKKDFNKIYSSSLIYNEAVVDEMALDELNDQTLLIVEDNDDIRKYVVSLLAPYCTLLQAEDGEQGLELAQKKIPDLIISDIMMPGIDGVTLTRKVKEHVATSHIPVILLTARATYMHQIEGYDTGADDYITKPFNEALLYSRIKSLLKNRQIIRDKFSGDALLNTENLSINKTDQTFLDKLTKTIQQHIDEESLTADFLSKELGMSHSVMYKKIKSLTGMTFVEFVRDYKLKIAKHLIKKQGFSVSEASYKVGYADRKYFSKLFKQKFGKNPSHFLHKKQ